MAQELSGHNRPLRKRRGVRLGLDYGRGKRGSSCNHKARVALRLELQIASVRCLGRQHLVADVLARLSGHETGRHVVDQLRLCVQHLRHHHVDGMRPLASRVGRMDQ